MSRAFEQWKENNARVVNECVRRDAEFRRLRRPDAGSRPVGHGAARGNDGAREYFRQCILTADAAGVASAP